MPIKDGLFKKGALSSSQFRWFYWGRTISLFGSAMTPVALAFAVLQTRHGQDLLGGILAAEILPMVLLLLIGGSVADRIRRDRLILMSNVGSGLSQTGMAVIVLTGANPYWMFPLAIVNGGLGAFASPAMRGIIPEIVESEMIKEANSLQNAARSTARVVGPAVAGLLVAGVGGGWGIAMDAISFFLAAACMSRVHIPSHAVVDGNSILQQMREGWSYFRSRRWIWSITAAFTLMNPIQMGVWQVLGPVIAKHSFGSVGWGVTLSVKAVGLLVASLAMLRMPLRRPVRAAMLAISLSGIPMIVLGQGYALPVLMMAALLAGVGSTISGIAWDTSLQQAVPTKLLSRVCAFDDFGSYIMIPLGEILAVPIGDIFGNRAVATLGGIAFIVIALLPLLDRSVRQMIPDEVVGRDDFHSLR